MTNSLFVAGVTGAIGQCLVPLLVTEGWRVFGMTCFAEKAPGILNLGATPVFADVFDGAAMRTVFAELCPNLVIHQLTDLPAGLDRAKMAAAAVQNAHIREHGTRYLMQAALKAGVARVIAQSIAFA